MPRKDISIAIDALRERVASRTLTKPKWYGNGLDRWLLRASHASQFGLFLLTLGALYFTVLPLYQKALLEEAIARKELDLKQVSTDLEKVYASARTFIVREFVFQAGGQCSGLFDRPTDWQSKSPEKARQKLADRIFGIDVGTCANAVLAKQSSFADLRKQDQDLFKKQLGETISRLTIKRAAAMRDFEGLPSKALANPDLLPQPTGIEAGFIDATEKFYANLAKAQISGRPLAPRVSFAEQRKALALELGLDSIVYRYADQIRAEMSELRALKWPS